MAPMTTARIRQTSGILVTLSPPYSPNALMPDNGLALLAAVLQDPRQKVKHTVQIIDLCTTDTIRMLFPQRYQKTLGTIFAEIQNRMDQGKKPRIRDLARLWLTSRQLAVLEKPVAFEIATELQKKIREREVDWIGFKLWNGAGFTMPATIVNELKKENSNLQIWGGGSHVDYCREHIFTAANFDALVFGHGWEALRRLADRVGGSGEELATIPNTIFKATSGIQTTLPFQITEETLNQLPFPAYDFNTYPAMESKKIKVVVVVDTEGCNYYCKFCGHPDKSGGRIIKRDPQLIVAEMERLQKEQGITHFRFSGSSTPGGLLSRVADILNEKGFRCRYTTFARIRDAITNDYPKLRQSGHFGQFFGIESADPNVAASMGKNFSPDQMASVVNASIENGYFTVLSFIASPPLGTEDTLQMNLDFLKSLNTPPSSVIINPPFVIPRTPWANQPENFGIELAPDYLDRMMRYPVKYMLPPPLWPSLPYKIRGRNSSQIFKSVMQMSKGVKALGIARGIPDDVALMAAAINIPPTELSAMVGPLFMSGNADKIDGLVERINQGISTY